MAELDSTLNIGDQYEEQFIEAYYNSESQARGLEHPEMFARGLEHPEMSVNLGSDAVEIREDSSPSLILTSSTSGSSLPVAVQSVTFENPRAAASVETPPVDARHQVAAKKCEDLIKYAEKGDLEKVRALLNEGVSPLYANVDGNTALMKAAFGGHELVVSLLLHRGSDVKATDTCKGHTALHHAARGRIGNCVPLLVRAGAEVDRRGHKGETPIYVAARIGNLLGVKELIVAGASIEKADYKGETPWDVAKNSVIKDVLRPIRNNYTPITAAQDGINIEQREDERNAMFNVAELGNDMPFQLRRYEPPVTNLAQYFSSFGGCSSSSDEVESTFLCDWVNSDGVYYRIYAVRMN